MSPCRILWSCADEYRYIKQTAQKLQDDFDSDVPKTVDELCSLPGVGPKMAFLALQVAWNMYVGYNSLWRVELTMIQKRRHRS